MSANSNVPPGVVLDGYLLRLAIASRKASEAAQAARLEKEECATLRRQAEAYAEEHANELDSPVKNGFGTAGVRHLPPSLRIDDDGAFTRWAQQRAVGADTLNIDYDAVEAASNADPEVREFLTNRGLAAPLFRPDYERVEEMFEADGTVPDGAKVEPERVKGYIRLSTKKRSS